MTSEGRNWRGRSHPFETGVGVGEAYAKVTKSEKKCIWETLSRLIFASAQSVRRTVKIESGQVDNGGIISRLSTSLNGFQLHAVSGMSPKNKNKNLSLSNGFIVLMLNAPGL